MSAEHASKHLTSAGAISTAPDGYWTCACGKRFKSRQGFKTHLASAGPVRRVLVIQYDVTGLTDEQIDALAMEAVVQAEASSDFTEDEPGTGHPSVTVLSAETETLDN